MKIGILIIGTNGYFVLACRFINRFHNLYNGNYKIEFHFFCDKNPHGYLPEDVDYKYYYSSHESWQEAVNSKFSSINRIIIEDNPDYLYFFDADTNIAGPFGDWFVGEHTVGKHFGYNESTPDEMAFDRNELSSCYIPFGTNNVNYYYGAFWGGKTDLVKNYSKEIIKLQEKNKAINHEPVWNDESYTNYYFNLISRPTKIIETKDFQFVTSCKGGMDRVRFEVDAEFKDHEKVFQENNNKLINVNHNIITVEK